MASRPLVPRLTINLLVHSGEENPKWDLDAACIATFTELLKRKQLSALAIPKPHTGFAGFLAVIIAGGDKPLPATLRVEGSLIWFLNDHRTELFEDDGALDRFLRDEARRHGFGEYLPEEAVGFERPS